MTDYITTDTELTAVADAIRSKGGTSASLEWPSGFSSAIAAIPTGGVVPSGSMSDPIRFFDYDGTLVASYSSLPESLPAVPTHAGLTNGSWNYTLQEVTTQFNSTGTCDVGANYDTSDGATRLYCHFTDGRLSPALGVCPDGTITIDWGDNSATDTLTGTSLSVVQTVQHVYAAAGDYVISITVDNGSFALYGTSNYPYILKSYTSTVAAANRVYAAALRRVEIGSGISFKGYAFIYCTNLESVSMPSDFVTYFNVYAFAYCYKLKSVIIPSSVTSISAHDFYYCHTLDRVSIPPSVTAIGSYDMSGSYPFGMCHSLTSLSLPYSVASVDTYTFYNCVSIVSINIPDGVKIIVGNMFTSCLALSSITIPSSVTNVNSQAFSGCYGMAEYHFLSTTPPTLSSTNAFSNIPDDCVIYVPTGSLASYQTANNWSTYASHMVGE